jgi:hypothetical protein
MACNPAVRQGCKKDRFALAGAGPEERTMTTLQAFLLGMMVAWTPSLLVLAWFLLRRRFRTPKDQPNDANEKPA